MSSARQPIERRLNTVREPPFTSYEGHSDAELEIAVRELAAAAGLRAVHVFLIPLADDLDGLQRGARYTLPDALRTRVGGIRNVDVTGPLPDFMAYARAHQLQNSSFYLACDSHWSAPGNAVAAGAVARHLQEKRPE